MWEFLDIPPRHRKVAFSSCNRSAPIPSDEEEVYRRGVGEGQVTGAAVGAAKGVGRN